MNQDSKSHQTNVNASELHERVKEEYAGIMKFFFEKKDYQNLKIGLYDGIAGEILLLSLHYQATHNTVCYEKIEELLDLGIDFLKKSDNLGPGICSGVAGFAWIIDHLLQHNMIDQSSEEVLETIDNFLYNALKRKLLIGNADLLHGAMGIGIYFLKRKCKEPAEEIIKYLQTTYLSKGREITWRIDKHRPDEGINYDLGLAHGMAGILHFLVKCWICGIHSDPTKEMIEGSAQFFRKNVQYRNTVYSYYPNKILISDYERGINQPESSRLGWCYGDLTILNTLYNVSQVFQDKDLEADTLLKISETSLRIQDAETNVIDAGFCHGSSGNAFIFKRLYHKTKINALLEAHNFWLQKTLNYNSGHAAADYGFSKNYPFRNENSFCDNFLEGLIGVGITFNSVLFSNQSEIEECLMLS